MIQQDRGSIFSIRPPAKVKIFGVAGIGNAPIGAATLRESTTNDRIYANGSVI
jgi:hypothetical protein